MNPTSRTLVFAAVAGVSALVATAAWYGSKPGDVAGFTETGAQFFPKFNDPLMATALTVADFEGDTNEVQQFAVQQNDDGLWVIPSHYDYPAEANERLARTAASLVGVKKVAIQSRSKDDWKSYGVADPDTKGTTDVDERGTRITLKDGSGNPLVDLIVGNEVQDREGYYYVRQPDKDTTYIAKMDVDLSAKFSDWIEPDLLKVSQNDFVTITVDNYSVDEQRGVIVQDENLKFAKEDLKASGKWTLAGLTDDEELDDSPVRDIASNLDELKIVGVRPKPEGLGDDLRVDPLVRRILESQMAAQGFFIAKGPDGGEQLVSNEGELIAGVDKGVQYTLYFGEIAHGSGKDIETGLTSGDPKDDDDAKTDDESEDTTAGEDEESGPRRYLLIKADFNEELLGAKPKAPQKPVKPAILDEPEPGNDSDPKAEPDGAPAQSKADEASDAGADSKEQAATEPVDADSPTETNESAPDEGGTETDDSCDPFDEPQEDDTETPADEDDATPATSDEPADEPAIEEPATETAEEPSTSDDAQADESPTAADAEAAQEEVKPVAEPQAADEATGEATTDGESASDGQKSEDAAATKPTDAEPTDGEPTDAATTDAVTTADEEPAEPEIDPKQVAQAAYDQALVQYETQKAAYDRDLKAYETKVEDGKKKAEELSRRFAGWYYVITADSFEKFRISRNDVVSKKEAEEATDEE